MSAVTNMQAYALGEFESSDAMLAAGYKLRERGYTDLDGHLPYPVEGANESLGIKKSIMPLIVLCGGLTGVFCGYMLIYYCNVYDFPINVGGRSIHGVPTFIPITFECGILFAALSAFFGSLARMGLPAPYHPVFEADSFRRASQDRFFISAPLGGAPTAQRRDQALQDFRDLGAASVSIVEGDER